MKICPACPARHPDKKSDCPTCGAELVTPEEHSPNTLEGEALQRRIHLEQLDFRDLIAQRYTGHFIDDRRQTRVAVFDGSSLRDTLLDPGSEAMFKELPDKTPPQILAPLTHQLSQGSHIYIAEQAPVGQPLSVLLAHQTFGWRVAAKLTGRLARILQWLSDQGVYHISLHPESIFVDKDEEFFVQLGERYLSDIFSFLLSHHQLQHIDRMTSHYLGYLPADLFRRDWEINESSLVYSLGILAYQLATGYHPFVSDSAKTTMHRNLFESPISASHMREATSLPQELAALIEGMIAKARTDRIDRLQTAIDRLAELLQEDIPELEALKPESRAEDETPAARSKQLGDTQLGVPVVDPSSNKPSSSKHQAGTASSNGNGQSNESQEAPERAREIKETLLLDQQDIENIVEEDRPDASSNQSPKPSGQELSADETRHGPAPVSQLESDQNLANHPTEQPDASNEQETSDGNGGKTLDTAAETPSKSPDETQQYAPAPETKSVEHDGDDEDFWDANFEDEAPLEELESNDSHRRVVVFGIVVLLVGLLGFGLWSWPSSTSEPQSSQGSTQQESPRSDTSSESDEATTPSGKDASGAETSSDDDSPSSADTSAGD